MTLDPDVEAMARRAAMQSGLPFKILVNRALRLGFKELLTPQKPRPYRTRPTPMGLRPGLSYDNIEELLAVAEGEAHK